MNDTNDTTRQARPQGRQPLSLKKTETSTVKQSFSHGRSKAVVVEKKRTRLAPGEMPKAAEAPKPQQPEISKPQVSQQQSQRDQQVSRGVVLRQLTEEEKVARSRAEEEAKHRAVEEARLAIERAAAEKRKAEEDARKAADELAKRH